MYHHYYNNNNINTHRSFLRPSITTLTLIGPEESQIYSIDIRLVTPWPSISFESKGIQHIQNGIPWGLIVSLILRLVKHNHTHCGSELVQTDKRVIPIRPLKN